jgi:hypothetical protein
MSRKRSRSSVPASLLILGIVLGVQPALAQEAASPPAAVQPPRVGTVFTPDLLRDLPTSENLFTLLETVQPSLISDRFSGGGLHAGQAPRVGGFLSSWTQTVYRVGDVDVTDPSGSGSPLFFPELLFWNRVEVATGALPPDINATGLAVTLVPLAPTPAWTGTLRGALSDFGLDAGSSSTPVPPIARLAGWRHVAAVASGPLTASGRDLAAVVGGAWTRGSQIVRDETAAVDADVRSLVGHLLFTPRVTDSASAIAVVQRAEFPFEYRIPFRQFARTSTDTSVHLQADWERRADRSFRAFASYTRRDRRSDAAAGPVAPVFERLLDGPAARPEGQPALADRWSLGMRFGSGPAVFGEHALSGGVEVGGSRLHATSAFAGLVGELVDGVRARIWHVATPPTDSRRRAFSVGIHVADRFEPAPGLTVDAGLRFDSVSGSAEGAAVPIEWRTWMPRAAVRWLATPTWQTALFASYSRSGYRLALDLLAVGDPAAPTADVFRWRDTAAVPSASALGELVARVGPGTGGNPAFSRIDDRLSRPIADEVIVGVEAHPNGSLRLRFMGMMRHERNLFALMNVGAPASAYSTFTVFDIGSDVISSVDDGQVPVFARRPATFGADSYLLAHPDDDTASLKGLELTARLTTGRLTALAGATASIAEAPAASRGFGPIENDHTTLGELFVTPNASTFSRGRVFTDRAYTVKLAGVYRFPQDVRLGVIARYQDGQPFARVIVVPDLPQGAEAVRAFANGKLRFLFIGTLDLRLQKEFSVRGRRVAAVLDAYNVLNMSNGVEEYAAAAPDVRDSTAIQPPRVFQAGFRFAF